MQMISHATGRDHGAAASDPRFLIVGFGLVVTTSFLIPHTAGLFLLLAYVVGLARAAGLGADALVGTARALAPLVLLVVLVNGYFVGGEPLPSPIAFLSRQGIDDGFYYAARVVLLVTAMRALLAALSPEAMARAVASMLGVASKGLGRRGAMYGFLALGFLPLLAGEIERIRVAQRFRGGGLDGPFHRRLMGARLLLVPLIVSVIHRSGQIAVAVETRRIRETIVPLLAIDPPARRDFLFIAITIGVIVVAFVSGRLWA